MLPDWPLPPLLVALGAAWFACELWIDRHRSVPGARRGDAGTLRLLHLAVPVAMALAVAASLLGAWPMPEPLATHLYRAGLVLMVAGMALRLWSVRVLAQHFTVDVAIRPDHRLIRHGPYRLLRHPSYSGMLLTLLGFALALGDWASLLAIAIPIMPAFARRIRVEERMLADAFPHEYPAYARATWRLLPGLW